MKELSTTGTTKDCVVAFILRNNKVLRGFRHYSETEKLWTAPGGRCDEGETFEQTIRREVLEETGITDLQIIEYIGNSPGWSDGDVVHVFLCDTKQEPTLMEPEKFSEWRWISLHEYHKQLEDEPIATGASRLMIDYFENKKPA